MVVVNFFIPLVLIYYKEAQVTILCALVGLAIGLIIFRFDGYRRLLSLMHVPWIFLVAFLWERLQMNPTGDVLGVWMRSIIVINSISLIIDAKDLVLYIRGNKQYPIS